jgi:hypothetical protein
LGSTNPTVIGDLREDYALSVYFDDTGQQFWFAHQLLWEGGVYSILQTDGGKKSRTPERTNLERWQSG